MVEEVDVDLMIKQISRVELVVKVGIEELGALAKVALTMLSSDVSEVISQHED